MRRWEGHGVVRGIAIGPAYVVRRSGGVRDERRVPRDERASERARLDAAVESVLTDLGELADRTRARGAHEEAAIFDAHGAILLDPALHDRMVALVATGRSAETAATIAAEELAARLAAAESPVLRERAADFRAIGHQVVAALRGESSGALDVEPGTVIVAEDLTPSQTATLDPGRVRGIALAAGGPTGHVAILARSLGIPAVVGAGNGLDDVAPGTAVAVDGGAGIVIVAPDDAEAEQLRERAALEQQRQATVAALAGQPARTADGHRVELAANIGRPEDLDAALAAGAEGSGLVRTELLYATRDVEPSEDEQAGFIAGVARALAPHRIVVRTLDVGADKPLPYLPQEPEENPFLGCRGIRLSLRHPDSLQRQLRAVLRGAAAGRVAVMFPFVGGAGELRAAIEQLDVAAAALRADGIESGSVERGIMVEIPAIALALDEIIDDVDFVSVGTNDLVQYLFAADRTNAATADIGDALHPACLRLLDSVVGVAHARGKWVGVCGEAASDPATALTLVGLGVDELSVVPAALGEAKAALATSTQSDLEALAAWALTDARGAAEVRERAQRLLP
jgi:phosphoenolpyruvate-protein phosphotransferase